VAPPHRDAIGEGRLELRRTEIIAWPPCFLVMATKSAGSIKVSVIGCGHWGPNHIRVFSQLRDSQVVACADADSRRLNAMGELYPEVQLFADYRDMLTKSNAEAVIVATPTRTHYQVVKDALNAGKHVLCEKPLCLASDQAQELVDLAASKKLVLMTGHVFLFNGGVVKLQQLIQAGEPGRICYLRAQRTNLGPVRRDVNSIFDLATHDISIFNWLLGAQPESVSAIGAHYLQADIEDVASITLRYPNSVLAHVFVSWLDPKKVREIVVVGDRKMVIWDDLASAGPITIYDKGVDRGQEYADFGQFQLLLREGDITIPSIKLEEPLKAQNRFFLQCIRDGRMPMNDGQFTVGIVKVLEAIDRSLKAQGVPVPVNR
jgi:predicted dehydrogenase